MPSNSYNTFLDLIKDVDSLIDTHSTLSGGTPGRKRLGFITRSGVVMLCAAWEYYNEELLLESITMLNKRINDIDLCPDQVKKTLSKKVKSDKHELKPIEIAGDGWKKIWHDYALEETRSLHTPKSSNLNKLFHRYLGIEKVSYLWKTHSSADIDHFVSQRGEIAHSGKKAKYVRIDSLKKQFDMIKVTAIDTDSYLSNELKGIYSLTNLPWKRTY